MMVLDALCYLDVEVNGRQVDAVCHAGGRQESDPGRRGSLVWTWLTIWCHLALIALLLDPVVQLRLWSAPWEMKRRCCRRSRPWPGASTGLHSIGGCWRPPAGAAACAPERYGSAVRSRPGIPACPRRPRRLGSAAGGGGAVVWQGSVAVGGAVGGGGGPALGR